MKGKTVLFLASIVFASSVHAGQPIIKAPGVEIGSDYISAPGVEIRSGSIKAPGVEEVYFNDDDTDKRITLNTDSLHINGNTNRIFGKGSLKHLYIAGNNNIVDLDNIVEDITVLGEGNTVLLPDNDNLQLSDMGNKNKVHYRRHAVLN